MLEGVVIRNKELVQNLSFGNGLNISGYNANWWCQEDMGNCLRKRQSKHVQVGKLLQFIQL